jgi:anti-sigma B factor antagonist
VTVSPAGGGVRVVTLLGEHDVASVNEIRARLVQAIDGSAGVAVDLRPATFVDSSVLGALVLAHRHAETVGVGLAVAVRGGSGDAVLDTIRRSGLDQVFDVHTERAAAVAAAADAASAA